MNIITVKSLKRLLEEKEAMIIPNFFTYSQDFETFYESRHGLGTQVWLRHWKRCRIRYERPVDSLALGCLGSTWHMSKGTW